MHFQHTGICWRKLKGLWKTTPPFAEVFLCRPWADICLATAEALNNLFHPFTCDLRDAAAAVISCSPHPTQLPFILFLLTTNFSRVRYFRFKISHFTLEFFPNSLRWMPSDVGDSSLFNLPFWSQVLNLFPPLFDIVLHPQSLKTMEQESGYSVPHLYCNGSQIYCNNFTLLLCEALVVPPPPPARCSFGF